MRDDGFVCCGLLPGRVSQYPLGFKSAVVIAGNDRRAVMAGFLADQNRCTGHRGLLSLSHTRGLFWGGVQFFFPLRHNSGYHGHHRKKIKKLIFAKK